MTAAVAGTGIGLAATAASASAAQAAPVLTSNATGYAAGNVLAPDLYRTSSTWNFRYASSTVVVPDRNNPSVTLNTQEFAVQLSTLKQTVSAQLYWNGSQWRVRVGQYYRSGAPADVRLCAHNFLKGSQARLDVYYNQGTGAIQFTAYDGPDRVCSRTFGAWNAQSIGGGSFREAFAGAVFGDGDPYGSPGPFSRPTTDFKVYAVSATHFTSYDGTKGTVVGPWSYQQLVYGTSFANVYANSPTLWNGGQNFGVWLRS